MKKVYKIVEKYSGGLRALFHGTDGTRHFPMDTWITAQIRENAKDGTSKTHYRSGFHTLPTYQECKDYLSRFKNRLDDLVIVEAEIDGEIWEKAHSPSNVLLSSKMKITKILKG